MPTFDLVCAETLAWNTDYQFFGETINYRNVENYDVRARFSTKTDTIAPLWSSISGLYPFITGDYYPFVLNGVSLGSGKITSFSAEGGADVSNKFYNLSFQILKTGDLSFLTGQLFSGYVGNTAFFPFLNNLTESVQYSQENNRTVDFSRSLDLEFEKGFVNGLSGSSGIAAQVLNALCDFGIYHPIQPSQYWSGQGIKKRGESLDEINNRYSYSEDYSYQSGSPFNWDYSHSLNFDENGVSTAAEQGKIQATKLGSERISYALSGWAIVKTGIGPRVKSVYDRWSGVYNSSCGFDIYDPSSSSLVFNEWAGSIDYNWSYSNDPSNLSGYFWSYETSINKDQDGYASVTENGQLSTKKYSTGNIDFLISKFSGISAGVPARVESLYDSTLPFFKNFVCSGSTTGELTEISNEKTYSERPTQISYNYSYTDDPSYSATGLFRRVQSTYSDNKPVHLANFFNIVNDREIAQGSNQSTLGVLTNRIEILGGTGIPISGYLSRAYEELRTPTGVYFVSDENYSYDPFNYNFSFTRAYQYSKYRTLNDYQV